MKKFRTLDSLLASIIIPVSALLFASTYDAPAQSTISGNIQTVPSMSNGYGRVSYGPKNVLSDKNTGNFSLSVANGNYSRLVEVPNCFQQSDNTSVSGNQNVNFQEMENVPISDNTKKYHQDNLEVLTYVAGTLGYFPIIRWNDSNLPLKVWANRSAMPAIFAQYFDSAIADITSKSNNAVQFSEQSSPQPVGVDFYYVPLSDPHLGGKNAATEIDVINGDSSSCYSLFWKFQCR